MLLFDSVWKRKEKNKKREQRERLREIGSRRIT